MADETIDSTFSKPDPKIAVSKETKKVLVAIGVGLIVLSLGLAALNWVIGSETTETTPPPAKSPATASAQKTTKTKSGPSEGLLTALLGSGAALVVVGFLYGRISSIKLPGGVEVGLTKDEEDKAAEKVGEKLKEKSGGAVDPATAAQVAQKATEHLSQAKVGLLAKAGAFELSDDAIEAVVDKAVAEAT
jgi:Na+-transporting methylmalonyl-CoA/oxaloacetate decarboxylase gamma subunit